MTRIAITGGTGHLGSHQIYELFKRHAADPDGLELLILGRGKKGLSLEARMRQVLTADGAFTFDSVNGQQLEYFLTKRCRFVEFDLEEGRMPLDGFAQLKRAPIDYFVHTAAAVSFADSPAPRAVIEKTNVQGTQHVLNLVECLDVGEMVYIGTAYACGRRAGRLMPGDLNLDHPFRNPYERSKHQAETMVRHFARRNGVTVRCFRPSTISGRLMDAPIGYTASFNVFYAWAAFFAREKARMIEDVDALIHQPVEMDVRITYDEDLGLNVVPVDYAAKSVWATCLAGGPSGCYHIVNDVDTPHGLYLNVLLGALNIHGVRQVDTIPTDLNRLESLYYRSVGAVFTPYLLDGPMRFDNSSSKASDQLAGLTCPRVDRENFAKLAEFAQAKRFGLNLGRRVVSVAV